MNSVVRESAASSKNVATPQTRCFPGDQIGHSPTDPWSWWSQSPRLSESCAFIRRRQGRHSVVLCRRRPGPARWRVQLAHPDRLRVAIDAGYFGGNANGDVRRPRRTRLGAEPELRVRDRPSDPDNNRFHASQLLEGNHWLANCVGETPAGTWPTRTDARVAVAHGTTSARCCVIGGFNRPTRTGPRL